MTWRDIFGSPGHYWAVFLRQFSQQLLQHTSAVPEVQFSLTSVLWFCYLYVLTNPWWLRGELDFVKIF